MSEASTERISTAIWQEESEADNPFAASVCRCAGFDVYGDVLRNASFVEYLYLLFQLEPPDKTQARILEMLAIALANPGPRDHSVRAAMSAGVGGSTHASALMAAIAVGAGNLGGAREIFHAMNCWRICGTDNRKWESLLQEPVQNERIDVWPEMEHPPGFDPNGTSCPLPVRQLLDILAEQDPDSCLGWLKKNRGSLESITGLPLTFSGVAAVAFHYLHFSPEQGEMLYLILRLPGAAAHALEQEKLGWRKYPFFGSGLTVVDDND